MSRDSGYSDSEVVSATFRGFLYVALLLLLVGVLGYAFWFFSLRADTSMQGERRTNMNQQAEQQTANNAYLHGLLATIETDKQGLSQFYNNQSTFCQIHQSVRVGQGCKSTAHVTDYNDQQEYERNQQNITAAQTSLQDDINTYNAYFSNSDVVGVDRTLPRHVRSDGSYTDVDGTFKHGVKINR